MFISERLVSVIFILSSKSQVLRKIQQVLQQVLHKFYKCYTSSTHKQGNWICLIRCVGRFARICLAESSLSISIWSQSQHAKFAYNPITEIDTLLFVFLVVRKKRPLPQHIMSRLSPRFPLFQCWICLVRDPRLHNRAFVSRAQTTPTIDNFEHGGRRALST